MVNYQKGKIYKITGTTDDGKELIYIGSTTLTLCQRLAGHKDSIKRGNNYSSKQVVLCKNCLITLIELFPCNTKEELLMKERYYYDLYDCINKLKPFRFKEEEKEYQKEYREENKQQLSEYIKEYYEENKEQIVEYQNEYRYKNKEKIVKQKKEYYEENREQISEQKKQKYEENKEQILEKQKEYYEENKQQILEKRKEYRENNKEQILEKKKEKITCECGCITNKSHLARHKKTKFHIDFCESQL